jgi:PAS domain S-box-containing protein
MSISEITGKTPLIGEDLNPLLEALNKTACVSKTDAKGTITYVNDKFVEISKYSREELIGQNHSLLKSGEHFPGYYKNLWDTISGGKVWRGEVKDRAKDGTFFWLDTSIAPILGKDGKPESYIAIRFPITDRKDAERDRQVLAAVIKSSNTAILVTDLDLTITFWNEGAEKIFGFSAAEAMGKNSSALLRSELTPEVRNQVVDALKNGADIAVETRYFRKDGVPVDAITRVSPIKDVAGKVVGIAPIITDITEHKKGERARMVSSERAYSAIFEKMGDMAFTVSPSGTLLSINPAFEKITGWTRDEWVGKEFRPLVHPDDMAPAFEVIGRVLIGQESYPTDARVLKKDGTYVAVEYAMSPIIEDGKVTGIFGISRDVTARKEGERIRQEMELTKAKEEFMFNTIHDLRGPTNILKIVLDEYRNNGLYEKYPEIKRSFNYMQEANVRMTKLIANLFQIVRGDRTEIIFKAESLNVEEIIQETIAEFSSLAKQGNISLAYEQKKAVPILGDRDALKEVFANLIENAIKYNRDGGSVVVTHEVKDGMLVIVVRDTGLGIEEQGIKKLFTPYFRAYGGEDIQGTGLGLFIVKKFVEKMHGKIDLTSKLAEGTIFTISMPIA